MKQSPPPPSDPQKWSEDLKEDAQHRENAWRHIEYHWHDELSEPALEMRLTPREAEETWARTKARVNDLLKLKTKGWQPEKQNLLIDLRLFVADEAIVHLFQKKEADADQRAASYIRDHWRREILKPFTQEPEKTQDALLNAGMERMKQRILSEEEVFLLQKWHIRQHLLEETLVAAVEREDHSTGTAMEHIERTWLSKRGGLYRYVLDNQGSEMDAEDVCAGTRYGFYKQAVVNNGVELKKTLEAYLRTIGQNLWKKKMGRQQKVETGVQDITRAAEESQRASLFDVEERWVRECAKQLPALLREVYIRHLDQKKNEQIAQELDISEQTVKNRKVDAKKLVYECLCAYTLNEPHKTVWRLHRKGMSDRDIAQQLNLDLESVPDLRANAADQVSQCVERARKTKDGD